MLTENTKFAALARLRRQRLRLGLRAAANVVRDAVCVLATENYVDINEMAERHRCFVEKHTHGLMLSKNYLFTLFMVRFVVLPADGGRRIVHKVSVKEAWYENHEVTATVSLRVAVPRGSKWRAPERAVTQKTVAGIARDLAMGA